MANFNTHFAVGATSSAIITGVLLSMRVIEPTEAIMAFATGTFGSLMPDIDANNSKAINIGFTVISLLVTILFVFSKLDIYSLLEMLIMGGVIFSSVRFGFIGVFRKISKHRGVFHSIPMALIWGVGTAIISYNFFHLESLLSWIYGIMMSFGYAVHLILDEIYSVDLNNRRVKKSAGTAFKLFSVSSNIDAIKYIVLYFILLNLFIYAPDGSMVEQALFSQNAWLNFKDVLLPYDGKWFIH
jgi:hypothetical protein